MKISRVLLLAAALGAGCDDNDNNVTPTSVTPGQNTVTRTDIVADQSGAQMTDPTLVNAWGLAFNPSGVAWVSANGSGLSEVYDSTGAHRIPSVVIPAPGGGTSAPTGQVFNSTPSDFSGDAFIFVTEDGSIAGWQPSDGTQAVTRVDNSAAGAIYKGVALGASNGEQRLYVADFHGGTVEVYDGMYGRVAPAGGFRDPSLPAGFAPFNVAVIQGSVLVAYAKQDEMKEDDVAGAGNGFVDRFSPDGVLQARLISNGVLDSPWGMVMTPSSFAAAPGRLLVGNFGDGRIHVYQVDFSGSGGATLVGSLVDSSGQELVIDGLWALEVGPGAGGFRSDAIYFTAGPDDEMHGVFGVLTSAGSTAVDGGSTGSAADGGSASY